MAAATVALGGCGGGELAAEAGPPVGAGGAGAGGAWAGASGAGGKASGGNGTAGTSGAAGSTGGAAGVGAGGLAGASGVAGASGSAAGKAGAGGSAGGPGGAGTAGAAGGAGGAGTGGLAGASGVAGASGSAAGKAGAGGSAGSAGGGGAPKTCGVAGDCDDGLFCNGAEVCEGGLCAAGAPVQCADLQPCSHDLCDEPSRSCLHVATYSLCPVELCKGAAKCDVATGCAYAGPPPSCDDGVACTVDSCDPAKGCTHAPSAAACADADLCNGAEQCDPTVGCKAGPAPGCDDGVPCTIESCDPTTGCAHAPDPSLCDDGRACNGAETCDPTAGCKAGAATVCVPDAIACTVDACVDTGINQGACQTTPDDSACPKDQFCRPALGGCVPGVPCSTPAQCDDGDPCNGAELCGPSGLCVPGVPPSCNDGVACTIDSCVVGSGCAHQANAAACDDGQFCNGAETCDAASGCKTGAAPACSDGVFCTLDGCSNSQGKCVFTPDDTRCTDFVACNGAETCTAAGCASGAPPTCADDGIACTVDACTEPAGCAHTPDDALCPLGLDCVPSRGGCIDPCVVTACNGHVYACGDCVDNDGDGLKDSKDSQCLGPCDHTEDSFFGGIPGQNNAPCKQDCYFDQDSGTGNDDCHWDHACDPHEVPPNYAPEPSQCKYDPTTTFSGYTCATAQVTQSAQCGGFCGPLTPNGCDCFGCCELPAASGKFVWLGSESPKGQGSCNLGTLDDPTKCKPCLPVAACLNPCDPCELCIGKDTLPPLCGVIQICGDGRDPCGRPGQPACAVGQYCVSGCSQLVP